MNTEKNLSYYILLCVGAALVWFVIMTVVTDRCKSVYGAGTTFYNARTCKLSDGTLKGL